VVDLGVLVGVLSAPEAEVGVPTLALAPPPSRRRLGPRFHLRSWLGFEALEGRPGVEQGAVDAEVVAGDEALQPGVLEHGCKEEPGDVSVEEPLAVLGERGGVEGRVLDVHVQEPLEQQVVVESLAELALTPHRVQRHEDAGLEQTLGRNGRAFPVEESSEAVAADHWASANHRSWRRRPLVQALMRSGFMVCGRVAGSCGGVGNNPSAEIRLGCHYPRCMGNLRGRKQATLGGTAVIAK
jgi:hypothetical protein